MWRCHGDQTLHSRQGYCAPFCWFEQALAYPIVAVFVQTEDAVRTQTFHWGNHAIYSRSQETTQHCKREAFSGYLFALFKYCFQCSSWIWQSSSTSSAYQLEDWVGNYCFRYKNVQLRQRYKHLAHGINGKSVVKPKIWAKRPSHYLTSGNIPFTEVKFRLIPATRLSRQEKLCFVIFQM